MSVKNIFLSLLGIALILMSVDFFLNPVSLPREEIFSIDSQEQDTPENNLISKIPQSFIQELPENTNVNESITATTLFSRLDITDMNSRETIQTSLTHGIQKFGVIYEIQGGEALYFQLRSALEFVLTEDDTIVDANNLGDYSLYYNDKQREDTVFFLSLIHNRIWGFEYPRQNHAIFKELFTTLVAE